MSPETRKNQLASELKTQIVSGRIGPGSRLPTRSELLESYGTSNTTLQQALDELIRHGFVETRGRAGTFVKQYPPHLTRFGVAYLSQPGATDGSWTRFHQAIDIQTREAQLSQGKRFVDYQNLYYWSQDNPGQQELVADIESHRLAGLILTAQANRIEHVTRQIDSTLPRVCLVESGDPLVPSIVPDSSSWINRAIEELISRGRKRIALISFQSHNMPVYDSTHADAFAHTVKEMGGETRPEFYLPANTAMLASVTQMVRLIMSLPEKDKPDGLIVNDDNLVEHAAYGLMQSGIQVGPAKNGGQVDVVAHANFPYEQSVSLPIIHLGYDTTWMLAKAIELLTKFRMNPKGQRLHNLQIDVPVVTQEEALQTPPLSVLSTQQHYADEQHTETTKENLHTN